MSAVTTLVATVAAAAGAVALYRFIDRQTKEFRNALSDVKKGGKSATSHKVIDFERDPVSGAFRPKD